MSFPQDSGQQPFFYNHIRTGRPELASVPPEFKARYREVSYEALYPFGHGMSYTPLRIFALPPQVVPLVGWNDPITISATVRNVGDRDGEEVVQLYIHDRVASRVRPVRELKAFRKIALRAGESQDVEFVLYCADLAFTNPEGVFAAEPGVFDAWICASSVHGQAAQFELQKAGDAE